MVYDMMNMIINSVSFMNQTMATVKLELEPLLYIHT